MKKKSKSFNNKTCLIIKNKFYCQTILVFTSLICFSFFICVCIYIYIYNIYIYIYPNYKKLCNAFIDSHFHAWCKQTRVCPMALTGKGGGNLCKMAKNCIKTTKSEFLGLNSRGAKPICTQWLQNWLYEPHCICNPYDHMRHQRLESYIGYSSLAEGGSKLVI